MFFKYRSDQKKTQVFSWSPCIFHFLEGDLTIRFLQLKIWYMQAVPHVPKREFIFELQKFIILQTQKVNTKRTIYCALKYCWILMYSLYIIGKEMKDFVCLPRWVVLSSWQAKHTQSIVICFGHHDYLVTIEIQAIRM